MLTGWKTIAVVVIQLLIYIFAWEPLLDLLDPQIIAVIAAVLMGILRFLTGTPVFKK